MASVSTDPVIGTVLDGRYRLVDRIARGGMSTVYRAVDERLDRAVAVKMMHPGLASDPSFTDRFIREAKAAARLSGPHVVAVFDQGSDGGHVYLVMELVPGQTLRDLLERHGRLSPALAITVLEPVLRGLTTAHRAGLVHRDVKPENVLIGADGAVKVADFGLVRAAEPSADGRGATRGMLIGTVGYLAPEQLTTGAADERTDVYAAGIMLYEMLTGAAPFEGDTSMAVAFGHVHSDVPAPSDSVADIEPALDQLVLRATRRDPGARPRDAGVMLAELADVRDDLGLPVVAIPSLSGHAPSAARSHTVALTPGALDQVSADSSLHRVDVHAGETGPVPFELLAAMENDDDNTKLPQRRRGRILAFFALLIVLFAVGGTAAWLFVGAQKSPTPSIYQLTAAQAESKLSQAGLKVRYDARVYDETVPKGSVVRQRPAAQAGIRRGGTVHIALSNGPERFTVPKLAGRDGNDAVSALRDLHLQTTATEDYSDSVRKGAVISTDPDAGTELARNSEVSLVVSKGPPPVDLPDLTGKSEGDANNVLQSLGLTSNRTTVFDDNVNMGDVVRQDPGPSTVEKGSSVTLTISNGPELFEIPDVRGMKANDAKKQLRDAGFDVDVIGGNRKVLQQIPGQGSRKPHGTRVTLLASLF